MNSCEVSTGKRIRNSTKLMMRRAKKGCIVGLSKIGPFYHLPCCNTVCDLGRVHGAHYDLLHSLARAQMTVRIFY